MAWATAENSVEEVLNLMQQHDVGYAFVGDNGVLEGIVSKIRYHGGLESLSQTRVCQMASTG